MRNERVSSVPTGKVKWYSAEKGFSFVSQEEGEDVYVGKLIHESLSTDQVDDIRLHVLSIMRRLGREVRLPSVLKILACSAAQADYLPAGGRPVE